MAENATIGRVSRPRGVLTNEQVTRLRELRDLAEGAQAAYRMQTVLAVEASSFATVSEVTGLSTNTLQRWKREAGR